MHIQEFINWYQSKTDEELLELAADLTQLTPEAQSALKNELVRRQLGLVEELQQQPNATVPIIEKPKPSQKQFSTSYRTSEFIAEVLRIYHARLRFFVMLMVPVVGVGYIAAIYGRRIAMQIAQHIFMEDISYSWISLAISSLVITRFFISWVLFFFAFGVICIAVFQMQSGDAPSLMLRCVRCGNRNCLS
ncbi:MAG TPA: hypothetical protein VLK33_14180 [Terriglobales bacterium]|nr:hypothetical protein [Terriglobales bacterium]